MALIIPILAQRLNTSLKIMNRNIKWSLHIIRQEENHYRKKRRALVPYYNIYFKAIKLHYWVHNQ